ncbi:hypothetical protein [Cetacean poxvirus 1]|nr:hypothetical protein [Cetacean poxvirus 1]
MSVIVANVISLFDVSLQFQEEACKAFCRSKKILINHVIYEYGYITNKTLTSNKQWLSILLSKVNVFIFYSIKQISIQISYLYDLISRYDINNVSIYFVRDRLYFTGDPPKFHHISLSCLNSYNRRKIRDLIILIHMSTCGKKVIREFIMDNFGDVESVITLLNKNIPCMLRYITMCNKNIRKSKNNKTSMLKFKQIVCKLHRLKYNRSTTEICESFNKLSISNIHHLNS